MEHGQQLRVTTFWGTRLQHPSQRENKWNYDSGLVDGKVGFDKDSGIKPGINNPAKVGSNRDVKKVPYEAREDCQGMADKKTTK